jgi:uncharacterized protein (DUF58 family)
MITPTARLIFFTAVVGLPFLVLAAAWPPGAWVAAWLLGALAVFALLDALRGPARLRALHVSVPPFVRWQKGRPGEFELRLASGLRATCTVQAGVALPPAIQVAEPLRTIAVPPGESVLSWPGCGLERGRHVLEAVGLAVDSPLGLWTLRTRRVVRLEFRVYPDLRAERQHVAALFLRRGMAGSHAQRRAGQGREFEKLRDYVPGDSLGDVHWKASAKRRHLVTKVHQIERSHEVYVIIDASRLSAREVAVEPTADAAVRPPTVTTLERFVTAALILGAAAERQGDQFGLITFSDRVHTFLRARAGQAHFDVCRDQLYTLQPRPVTPDYEELCALLRARLSRRALLVFLTALDDPFLAESFASASEVIARQHLILVNMLRPAGVQPVFAQAVVERADDLYRVLGGHLQWEKLRELEATLRQRGMRLALLDPTKIAAELVKQHADVRARELV